MSTNTIVLGLKPWLLLMVPNLALMTIMLMSYHPSRSPKNKSATTGISDPSQSASLAAPPSGQQSAPTPGVVPEGSTAWLANVQGLQNLMGFMYVSFSNYPSLSLDLWFDVSNIGSQLR